MALFFKKRSPFRDATVKVYHGYGHTHNLVVYGHAFRNKPYIAHRYTTNVLRNILQLLRLFFVKPLPGATLQLRWEDEVLNTTAEDDGFFKFEWESRKEIDPGWQTVTVDLLDDHGQVVASGNGSLFVPHATQYGIISDIDDTILISHSATIGKRLRQLFTLNPRSRQLFPGVAAHYSLMATARTTADVPNPFFYVSSSEWNLYNYLAEFFTYNRLPPGVFLLNQLKQWFELWKTGKTKHQGKMLRIVRILEAFPRQQFVLLGDNSQSDPAIYASLATKMKGKIFAVYIRNVRPAREPATIELLKQISSSGVATCFFKESSEAIGHSKTIGLIN